MNHLEGPFFSLSLSLALRLFSFLFFVLFLSIPAVSGTNSVLFLLGATLTVDSTPPVR